MMEMVFALVLLVVAGAVVLLFAMVGELASRVPDPDRSSVDQTVRLLEGARVGRAPSEWPADLSELASAESPLLLVLSTACGTCIDVAKQVVAARHGGELDQTGIVMSCGSRERGEDFLESHGLRALPCFVDEGGSWVTEEFGVTASPTGLAFRDGRLAAAATFADVMALRAAVAPARVETARAMEVGNRR